MVKFSSAASNAITLFKIKSPYSASLVKDILLRPLTVINLQRGFLSSVLECTEVIRLSKEDFFEKLGWITKRVKRFTLWLSCLLCGRIYQFFNIHKELPLMLQKIPNVSSHPHSVKMTTEYNHT